jgi:uncharacterized membrane protein
LIDGGNVRVKSWKCSRGVAFQQLLKNFELEVLMGNRVVMATTMAALMGLTAATQVACQSTMASPAVEATVAADENCRDAVINHLEGISEDQIDIHEAEPLMQNGFMVLEWQALDRLAKGQCRMHEDGSLAEFIRDKE